MKINDVVILNSNCNLSVFYYNSDPDFLDHDLVQPNVGQEYTIVGYVLAKSNQIDYTEDVLDKSDYYYVIKDNGTSELFRLSEENLKSNFVKK